MEIKLKLGFKKRFEKYENKKINCSKTRFENYLNKYKNNKKETKT